MDIEYKNNTLKGLLMGKSIKTIFSNGEPIYNKNELIFSSDSPFTLKTYNLSKNWDGKINYALTLSDNVCTWMQWNGQEINSSILYSGTNNLYPKNHIIVYMVKIILI